MKTMGWTIAATALFALLVPATGMTRPEEGATTLTIFGTGANDRRFDVGTMSVGLEYGRFWTPNLQLGLRQGASFQWVDGADNLWNGATRVFSAYHFVGASPWVPQVGASLGFIYGDNVDNSFTAGLELGFKYYVREQTYIGVLAEYQFVFESPGEFGDQFNDGAIFYNLGVGFHF
jgi:hypothetical protein